MIGRKEVEGVDAGIRITGNVAQALVPKLKHFQYYKMFFFVHYVIKNAVYKKSGVNLYCSFFKYFVSLTHELYFSCMNVSQ